MALISLNQRALACLSLVLLEPHAALASRGSLGSGLKVKAARGLASGTHAQAQEIANATENGASVRTNKRINAIIATLEDMFTSMENEEKEERTNYAKYTEWCSAQKGTLSGSLSAAKQKLPEEKSSEITKDASIASEEHAVEAAKKTHKELTTLITQAEVVRSDDNADYKQDMLVNSQSRNQVGMAIDMLSKVQTSHGFPQDGSASQIRMSEPGQSSFVLGTMKQLNEKLLKTKSEMEATESVKVETSDALLFAKRGQLTSAESTISDGNMKLTGFGVDMIDIKRSIVKLTEEIKELKGMIKDVDNSWSDKAKSWKIREADRAEEKNSMKMAIDYLKSKTGSLISPGDTSTDDVEPDVLLEVSRTLSTVRRINTAGSGYGVARKAVKALTGLLESQQKKEDKSFARCQDTLDKQNAESSDGRDIIDELQLVIGEKNADAVDMQTDIDGFNSEIKTMQEEITEAKTIRVKAQKIYATGSRDRALAIKILNQAKGVLGQFYATADVQLYSGAHKPSDVSGRIQAVPPKTWSKSSRKDILGRSVIGMLEDVMKDIMHDQRSADEEEQTTKHDFNKLVKDSQARFADLMLDVTNKMKMKAKTLVQVNGHEEDKIESEGEFIGIQTQLAALHKECDELIKFYDARKKGRTNDIMQLRDAFDILSGSSIAARTGLIQDVSAVMASVGPDPLHVAAF